MFLLEVGDGEFGVMLESIEGFMAEEFLQGKVSL